jgi:hypothetical protein
MKIAIMQPTFLPWMGYFAMIDEVNKFVFLDDVQFIKRSWQCRNQIKTTNGSLMLTLEMLGSQHRPLILEAKLSEHEFENKLYKTIDHNLKKAPFFELSYKILIDSFKESERHLAALNEGIIQRVCSLASIDVFFCKSSELNVPGSNKSQRLLEVCQSLGGTEFLSAKGSAEYLRDENPFFGSSVDLKFFNYEHPRYEQLHGEFVPYMSVMDVISNVDPLELKNVLKSGVRPALGIHEV